MDYTTLKSLYLLKVEALLKIFPDKKDPKAVYQKIIKIGETLPPFPIAYKTEKYLVNGCQSEVFLVTSIENDCVQFQASSNAIISSGLIALLFFIYNNEPPELVTLFPPKFLEELHLEKSLSPGRSNGLASIYTKMKQSSIQFLNKKTKLTS